MIEELGEFEVTKGTVVVGDPCYDEARLVRHIDALPGTWVARVTMNSDDRIAVLEARHQSYVVTESDWGSPDFEPIGVDSGQAGIFDAEYHRNPEVARGINRLYDGTPIRSEDPWYSLCCDRTLSDKGAGIIPFGVVSTSGYGDGCYEIETVEDDDGDTVAIRIIFIGEED